MRRVASFKMFNTHFINFCVVDINSILLKRILKNIFKKLMTSISQRLPYWNLSNLLPYIIIPNKIASFLNRITCALPNNCASLSHQLLISILKLFSAYAKNPASDIPCDTGMKIPTCLVMSLLLHTDLLQLWMHMIIMAMK